MTREMQKRSYASVKNPIPAMMIAVKWYHCVFAASSAPRTCNWPPAMSNFRELCYSIWKKSAKVVKEVRGLGHLYGNVVGIFQHMLFLYLSFIIGQNIYIYICRYII